VQGFVLGVFALVYLGMILGGLPGLALDRTGIALLGALALVAGGALTLTSIAERAGDAGRRIPQLRDELATASERITRKNRRVSALLNAHQKVITELLQALVAIQGGRAESTTGALVDAEA